MKFLQKAETPSDYDLQFYFPSINDQWNYDDNCTYQFDNRVKVMTSFGSEKTLYLALSHKIIEEGKEENYQDDPLAYINKSETNLHGQFYEDDLFKLSKDNLPKGVVIKRLRDIFQIGSSIKEPKYQDKHQHFEQYKFKSQASKPSYLSEIRMIPEKHFLYLIEPQTINEKGFYHVAAVKEGRIIKKTVDDFVYYDEITKKVYTHPFLEDKPWIHIIMKVWAKLNRGYENLPKASPFNFIKAFTYPDWSVFNPGLENLEVIIQQLSSSKKNNDFIYIGKTKDDPKVGLFGFIPNCASYLITGYFQEYGNIFIQVKSFSGDKWNKRNSDKKVELPSDTEHLHLSEDEFLIPVKEFVNVFHLIYFTNNKFSMKNRIFYHKYTINQDAGESKAKLIRLEVQGQKNTEQEVNINLYFPSVQGFDIKNPRANEQHLSIPYCKMLLGRQLDVEINEGSYADSVRQKMLKNEGGNFLSLSNQKYEYVKGDYIKGYSNDVSYHLKLKPGNYILRLKIQKLFPEYRALLNITSSSQVKISQNKNVVTKQEFLSEVLSSKARQEERNTVFPTQNKKQTWIMTNDDFNEIGYGSILFQIGKSDARGLTISINHQKVKESGYRFKNMTLLMESKFRMYLKEKQSKILILKEALDWKGLEKGQERVWPPEGIDLKFDSLPEKLQTATKL